MKCKNPISCLTRQKTTLVLLCGVLIGISLVAGAYGNFYKPYAEFWSKIQGFTKHDNDAFFKTLLTVPVAIYSIAIPLSLRTIADASRTSPGNAVKQIVLKNPDWKRLKLILPLVIIYMIICLFFNFHSGFPVIFSTLMVIMIVVWFFRYVQFLGELTRTTGNQFLWLMIRKWV